LTLEPAVADVRRWFIALAVVAVVGIGAAGLAATSPAWYTDFSVSHLGVDPGSDAFFNGTMVTLGVIFLGFARHAVAVVRAGAAAGVIVRGSRAIETALWVIGPALMATGLFQIDEGRRAHAIHNLAGFSVPILVMLLMLTEPWTTPAVRGRFRSLTAITLGLIVALFVLAVLEAVHYSLMEILGFILCGVWLRAWLLRIADLVPDDARAGA